MIQLLIAGIDRTNLLQYESLVIDDSITERSNCNFRLTDVTGSLLFTEGQTVEIYENAVIIFAGTIFYPKKFNPFKTNILIHDIECVDYNEIADRFLVAEAYVSQTSGFVVNDLFTKYLQPEGITIGQIQTGITVESAKFPRVSTLSQVLDELSEFNGFIWYIDYNKEFYFVERNFNQTGKIISEASAIRNVVVKFNKSQLRNRQYIRGGDSQTDTINLENPTPKPDGVSKTFVTRFPLAEKPRIFIDTVEINADDIGINGKDLNKKWYYQTKTNTIIQDDAETTLTTELLEVTYKGLFPLLVVAEDPSSINNRQIIQGGSGIYEAIDTDASISRSDFGLEIAQAKLLKYSETQTEITFDSFDPIFSGELITFNFPIYGVNQGVLVDHVQITEQATTSEQKRLIYSVHAVSGESFGSWVQFFKKLYSKPDKIVIRDDEILVILNSSFELQNWSEISVPNVFICPLPAEDLFPDESLFPC